MLPAKYCSMLFSSTCNKLFILANFWLCTYAISLKLPDFWPSDPELWLAQVEALFEAQSITCTQEKTKFAHVVPILPARYASEVRDIILPPPEQPYNALKEELQKRVCMSRRQQLQQLLHVEDLGDRRPSQLLRQMLKLRGGTTGEADQCEIFREIYLQKLPLAIHTALAIQKHKTLSVLAEMADNMVEVQGPQGVHNPHGQIDHLQQASPEIATITSEIQKLWRALQSQDKKSSAGNPGFCWYHERFGVKATKCRDPCTFKASSEKRPGQSMNAAHTTGLSSILKRLDKNSKRYFLVDTEAKLSVFPACRADRSSKSNVTLRTANNSSINTYELKQLVLNFGLPRPLTWKFQVTDVTQPIIGADFLLQHKLLVYLDQKGLIDTRNVTRIIAESSPDSTSSIYLISVYPSKYPFSAL